MIVYVVIIGISLFRNKDKIQFWTVMTRDGSRISKIAITFWFVLPIIIYQSVTNNAITPGLIEVLYAVFAAELGVRGIDLYGKLNNKHGSRRYDKYDRYDTDSPPARYTSDDKSDDDSSGPKFYE